MTPAPYRLLRRIAISCVALAAAVGLVAVPAAHASTPSVLSLMNTERSWHHLAPMRWSHRLSISAARHNYAMAADNVLSHQLPGEYSLGTRISRTTFPWDRAGENIAWNSAMTYAGALVLERMMYNEKAPYNGHRLNILSTSMNYVGISVLFDTRHHKVWLTEDFAHYAP